VALAFLVGEEVGVDRSGEARIVQPEIVAALIGALRPGGADLGLADHHAVAWSVLDDNTVRTTLKKHGSWNELLRAALCTVKLDRGTDGRTTAGGRCRLQEPRNVRQ